MTRTFLPHVITDDSALGGSVIERSFRFDRESSTHLTRTPAAQGDRRVFTLSWWMKLGTAGSSTSTNTIFSAQRSTLNPSFQINLQENRLVIVGNKDGSSSSYMMSLVTAQLFRNSSSWYHCVVAFNTSDGTSSNRIKIYVNGSQVTDFDAGGTGLSANTYPSSGDQTSWGTNEAAQLIGELYGGSSYFDGYLAEINYVDGSQLDPSSFGYTDFQTGLWRPKRYTGGYGDVNNGFYIDFSDNSSITNMMLDKSGNGNNLSPDNCNTEDSMLDTPSNNFCNLLNTIKTASTTLSQGNLFYDNSVLSGEPYATHKTVYGTMSLASGKWYWEVRATTISGYNSSKYTYGVSDVENTRNTQSAGVNYLLAVSSGSPSDASYSQGDAVSIYTDDLYKNGTRVIEDVFGSGVDIAAGDKLAIALDVDAGKVWFARNGTWLNGTGGSASTTLDPANHDLTVTTGKVYTPAFSAEDCGLVMNFGQDGTFAGNETAQGNKDGSGQGNFYYAVPSGFKSICAANLPITTPAILNPQRHFDTVIYTGNGGSSQTISGLEFKPDLLFFKGRNHAAAGLWIDSVRGVTKNLRSNSNAQEGTTTAFLESFNLDGFTVGQSGTTNGSSETNVAWCWKAGGAAVSNTDGSITTSCSANQEAGFSIITYTGTGSQTTVGHGLGKAPKVMITKLRDTTTQDWFFNPGEITGTRGRYIKFNTTDGVASDAHTYPDVAPTSTVYTIGGDDGGNSSNGNGYAYVAYCWSEIPGYSKFGTYTGNSSSDGTYVPLGFRPAWLLVRRESGDHWIIKDSTRSTTNDVYSNLLVNSDVVEFGSTGNSQSIDFLSDGFKLRGTDSGVNGSSNTYIYMAFAEQSGTTPFDTFSNAR